MPYYKLRIAYCVSRIPFRRYLPIVSALGMAVALVWLLASVTRPAQASAPACVAAAVSASARVDQGRGSP